VEDSTEVEREWGAAIAAKKMLEGERNWKLLSHSCAKCSIMTRDAFTICASKILSRIKDSLSR